MMGEHGLLAPHRAAQSRTKAHDGTIVTDRVNEMWGTDMTQTITTDEGKAYVFVAVGHSNSEIAGIHAARSANRFEALEPVRQGVTRCFGSIAPNVACGLRLRHDHGSNYMSMDFQAETSRRAAPTVCIALVQPDGGPPLLPPMRIAVPL